MACQWTADDKINRRFCARYSAPSETIIVLNIDLPLVGTVIDISMSGLAFEYVNFGRSELRGEVHIDIFYGHTRFTFQEVPCTVIYNAMTDASASQFGFSKQRCGLQFSRLSSHQENQLESFLAYCRGISN